MIDDLEQATALARTAARAILDVKLEARASATAKDDDSPVTAADLAADKILRAGLAARGDTVVSEEAWKGDRMPGRGRVWVIDPIDGTEDFVRGTDDYVVQVGLVVDGAPVLGVVLQPETGKIWRGVVKDGFVEVIEGDVVSHKSLTSSSLSGPPRLAVSVSHPSDFVDFVVAEFGAVAVGIGSVGLKVAAIIEGRADAYVTSSKRIKVWDTCAPAALLLAAGGAIGGLAQRPLPYDGPIVHDDGVCAWSPAARAVLRPKLAAAIARFRDRN